MSRDPFEQLRVSVSTDQSMIAVIAEQSSDFTGMMIVVNAEPFVELCVMLKADKAIALLLFEELLVLGFGDAILSPKTSFPRSLFCVGFFVDLH